MPFEKLALLFVDDVRIDTGNMHPNYRLEFTLELYYGERPQ